MIVSLLKLVTFRRRLELLVPRWSLVRLERNRNQKVVGRGTSNGGSMMPNTLTATLTLEQAVTPQNIFYLVKLFTCRARLSNEAHNQVMA